MTNQLEMVDGVLRPMSDADQAAYDAIQTTYASGLKGRLLNVLATHRYSTASSGLTVAGVPFETDTQSITNLMAIYIVASANPTFSVNWKGLDNTFYNLSASAIVNAGNIILAYIQKCFNTEANLIANIAQYTDSQTLIAAFDAAMAA